ncbi:MAG: YbaB/EbfC family nucleoid-associated protein [Evtepia sp.]
MAKGYGRPPVSRKGGAGMGGGLNMDMIKKAQKMQQEMETMQGELLEKEYSATAGGGVVSATINGKHELKKLVIAPEVVDPEDIEMLQDMVMAAINEANRAAELELSETMDKLSGGINLPF